MTSLFILNKIEYILYIYYIYIHSVYRFNSIYKTEVDLGRVRYEITDGHCVSPPGTPTKGKDFEEGWQDGGETN